MAEIVRRADVGMTTLFRRFPPKEALLRAVFAENIAACEADLAAALAAPHPWHAFQSVVAGFCTIQVHARGLASAIVTTFLEGTGFEEERLMVERNMVRIIARAQASGDFRSDIDYDFLLLLKANAGVATVGDRDAPRVPRRSRVRVIASGALMPRLAERWRCGVNVTDDSKFFFTTYHGGRVNIALHVLRLPIVARGLLTRNTPLILAALTLAELGHAYNYYFLVHRNPRYGSRMLPYQLGYTALVMPIVLKLFRW